MTTGCAQGKTKAPKQKAYFKLVEAYTQTTVPGIPGASHKTNYYFVIVWEGTKSPESFFWRGENGWLNCNMAKAHKISGGRDYTTQVVLPNDIHRKDTLELTTFTGGKFPIPAEVTGDVKNTLFFKTGGSAWLSFPVNKIDKHDDVIMR